MLLELENTLTRRNSSKNRKTTNITICSVSAAFLSKLYKNKVIDHTKLGQLYFIKLFDFANLFLEIRSVIYSIIFKLRLLLGAGPEKWRELLLIGIQ